MERRFDERIETHVQLTCRVPARPCRAIMHDLSRVGCRLEVTGSTVELGATAMIDLPGAAAVAGRGVGRRGEREPEQAVSERADIARIPSREGFLTHWMRRLSGRAA